jgi:3-hydroxyisobutyrate dehydrogenase
LLAAPVSGGPRGAASGRCAILVGGDEAGVEPLALFEAIRLCAHGRSRTFDSLAGHHLVNRHDPPDFALKLALEDVSLAAEMAREVGVPTRMIDLTRAELTEAVNRAWGQRDSRAFLLQQERAGIQVEVHGEAVAAVMKARRR